MSMLSTCIVDDEKDSIEALTKLISAVKKNEKNLSSRQRSTDKLHTLLANLKAVRPFMLSVPISEGLDFVDINEIVYLKAEGRGKLDLNIDLKANHLCCSISDNGVGRALPGKKIEKHKSLGTSITNKRIKLINLLYKFNISPEVIDLKDAKGNNSGTLVKFLLPREIVVD